ncbi:nuclear transport factor 2 family protein [Winogradskyella immobilis]|uniref:Nuclear transport factor 2 family protein n=1 Tax=Winogradskyella immobilis TaxID=2816852 RepID=A0ABS8EKE0_9FLAO|nr:nuclear transport factor 2 family protein [Winogradskyella immobilis]MCC1483679.1 nuclear transport factor 2 family protein [Winogradskyella immobilis]MCG0015773.1 nuclear transport factor 2 family protein [Winogradskyella immobilis]
MKQILTFLVIALSFNLNAQTSQESAVKETIIKFFEAFHKQDSIALKSMVTDDIILQSISKNNEGKTVLNKSEFNRFVTSIASIPKERNFQEKLTDFSIQVDGDMANAWTPYEFWIDNKFSHCGVNSFQLIRINSEWKIIYLVDTRRRDHCVPKKN